jgi:hypothetical protein
MLRAALRLIVATTFLGACGEGEAASRWSGTADTLASGQVDVRNTATPMWAEGEGWRVVEDTRIGSMDGQGPDVFGQIRTMQVDAAGRIWVYDGQVEELRVFDTDGSHIRTIGRKGGGPGEFAQGVSVDEAPDGTMWVMDPSNNRISVFDTAGNYLGAKRVAGGFVILPWPGGFDEAGRYYAPVPRPGEGFSIAVIRHDTALAPIDTLTIPRNPNPGRGFEHRSNGGSLIAGIPFSAGLRWRLSPAGTVWGMWTGEYRLFELTAAGDTLRTITRAFTPLPVTDEDRAQAREDLKWFTDQGGRADWSRIPDTKPATRDFFLDDEGNLWVEPMTTDAETGFIRHIFDADGRYLGVVRLPFALGSFPVPIVRDGMLYGVTRDELEVPYIVSARVVK